MEIIKNEKEFDQVLSENPSVFVDFFATWCGPCKMVAPIVEELAAEMPEVKFIKVDVDEASSVAARYGIMSIPTMITFKNGEPVAQSVGFQPKEPLKEFAETAK